MLLTPLTVLIPQCRHENLRLRASFDLTMVACGEEQHLRRSWALSPTIHEDPELDTLKRKSWSLYTVVLYTVVFMYSRPSFLQDAARII